jgi:hypothetical protein
MFAGWKCHFGKAGEELFVLPIQLLCQNCFIDFPEYAGTGVINAISSGCGSGPDIYANNDHDDEDIASSVIFVR